MKVITKLMQTRKQTSTEYFLFSTFPMHTGLSYLNVAKVVDKEVTDLKKAKPAQQMN